MPLLLLLLQATLEGKLWVGSAVRILQGWSLQRLRAVLADLLMYKQQQVVPAGQAV